MRFPYSSGNPTLDMLIGGMGNRESGMNFKAVGPATRNGDHAYGFSQVLRSNIGPWTQEVLGVRMSPQQYLNNPEAQFAVTSAKLGGYLNQYGNREDALSMWHSGRPMARSGKANDGYVNTHDYVKQIMAGQDPRSFVASASPQATGESPMQLPGATLAGGAQGSPQATVGPQSISLGDQETQQPFNNIGSTLANMGASIASLDRGGTGIASLNASRVASNLAAQEQAREAQGGWKYAGQTQNGQGLMFQNAKGEVRIEPLAPGFSGQREPETIRTLRTLQAEPSLMDTMKEKNEDTNKQQPMLSDEGRRSVVEDYIAGNDAAFKNLNKADVAQAQNQLAEFKQRYGITSEDIMGNRGKWRGVFGAERTYSQRVSNVSAAESSLSAAIDQGRELLKDPELKSMLNQPRIINQFNQMTVEQLNSSGLGKLAQLKENFETVAQDYTRINAQGGATTTVRAQDIARGILNTGMSDKAINELFDFMGQSGLRVKKALETGQEELRTNARKHTRLEDYKKNQEESERAIAERLDKDMSKFGLRPASSASSGGASKAPSTIRNANDLMGWIQSQGLRKGDKFTLPDGTEGIVP